MSPRNKNIGGSTAAILFASRVRQCLVRRAVTGRQDVRVVRTGPRCGEVARPVVRVVLEVRRVPVAQRDGDHDGRRTDRACLHGQGARAVEVLLGRPDEGVVSWSRGEGAKICMSWMAALPDGVHVANTRPLLGAFVTVTVCSPLRVLAAVTQRVWPLEVPQLLSGLGVRRDQNGCGDEHREDAEEGQTFPRRSDHEPAPPVRTRPVLDGFTFDPPMSVLSVSRRPLEVAGARQESLAAPVTQRLRGRGGCDIAHLV